MTGGYTDTTGTEAQSGGFMSAANMTLNAQTINQIGGALQQLTSTGAVSSTGTQQLLSSLQAQLGSSFTQSTVASNLNTSFTAEGGGFDPSMMVVAMMAVMISAVTAGAASAAIGSALSTGVSSTFAAAVQASAGVVGTSAGLGNIALSAAIGSMVGSSASQLMTSGTLNFGQVLDTGLVSGLTAGLTDGITYSSTNGVGFTADPIVDGSGVQTLASLAGVQMTASTLVPQAGVVAGSVPQEILALGTDASIQAGVQTAIEGGSFLNNLKTAGVQDLAAVGAYTIGNLAPTLATDLGPVGGELATITAHAALGCAASAAEGTGCAGGAIGAAASSAFTSLIPNPTDSNGNATSFTTGEVAGLTATSTLLGAVAAGLAGANPLGGAAAAENETLNNRLLHPEEQQAINQLANGDPVAAQNLQAAACALVNCAAQFAPGTQQYNFYTALDAQGSNLTTEQAELLNYDEPSYSSALNGNYIQQTPGSSLFQYTASDAQTDLSTLQTNMTAASPGKIQYVTVQGGVQIGGSLSVNLVNGNVYFSPYTSPTTSVVGGAVMFGIIPQTINQGISAQANAVDSLLTETSFSGTGCAFGLCSGFSQSPNGPVAVEVGFGAGGKITNLTPAVGPNGSVSYGIKILTIPGFGGANAKN